MAALLQPLSPFDGSPLTAVAPAQPLDFIQALAPAKKALENFASASAAERAAVLTSIADRLRALEGELALLEASSDGWPLRFVLEKSIRPVERLFRRLAAEVAAAPAPAGQATGLIAILAPGPFGFRVAGERLAPALAAGNAVFIKVSSKNPVSALMWPRVLEGLPEGLVHVFAGPGAELGALMASHPSVRAVSFAGRPSTAAAVARAAAQGWKKMQISAGVKNSLLVLPDADLGRLPEMLAPVLLGPGRLGWGLSRIFVTEAMAPEFTALSLEYLESLKPLTSPEGTSPWTPSPPETGARLRTSLETAGRDQAKVLWGGDAAGGFHARPAVLRDLTHCSTLQLEELDHPVVILDTVKYAHEMAKWTNTADFGFAASIWGDAEKARRIGEKLQVGRVWINGWMDGDEAFAGWKKSFLGIPDFDWRGGFFSDVKKMTAPEV